MSNHSKPGSDVSRRTFLQTSALAAAGAAVVRPAGEAARPLEEFGYGEVTLTSPLHEAQRANTRDVLMALSDDSLLKPLRAMAGMASPGEELGGWYLYNPDYDYRKDDAGFAPACTFGQWVSALARNYAISGDEKLRERVLRLNRLFAQTLEADPKGAAYERNRFPAYCYDKLTCGLMDAHRLAGDPQAWAILRRTYEVIGPHLPPGAVDHDRKWRQERDISWDWDESYTVPENQFLVYQMGAGARYREMGKRFLHEEYFGPLAEGRDDLGGRHAYSHVNALCSAMQAWFTLGSERHLRAAKHGFDLVEAQSYATGGWGPDEQLRPQGSGDVVASLQNTHHSFETPCGAYAHMKLTRYLLRATREARYGDSMERVMYNTILGALPMQTDGRTFYYADNHLRAKKVYSDHRWPCCSGTHPQVAADYRINSYFRDADGVWVNLYIPGSVRWMHRGARVELRQSGGYPLEGAVRLEVAMARGASAAASEFALRLRIPQWAEGAAVAVNGKRVREGVEPGRFAVVRRAWRDGDVVELELPLRNRVEMLAGTKYGALLRGPLVLFPLLKDGQPMKLTREQLLAARAAGAGRWSTQTGAGAVEFLPFTGIGAEEYSTYSELV